jgi:hypothetical protein
MRMFNATTPDNSSAGVAMPADILHRLAFGRPQRRPIQPALPVAPAADILSSAQRDELVDLAQRVRESGEW